MVARYFAFFLLAAVAVHALPTPERYMWMPDGFGKLHLVDLQQEELPSQRAFNGETDVTLNLYTRSNPTSPQFIKLNSIPSNFNGGNPTRIVIHGWNSGATHMDHFRSAYITQGGNFNVIIVDWSKKASAIYSSAKSYSKNVGEYVAQVVKNLVSNGKLSLNNLYLIGHSLGAHAVGVTGYNLDGKTARVIGLDAAAPLFGSEPPPNRIDITDGINVQGVHTSVGLLGWGDAFGHADFYPNGGSSQAGCGLDVSGACSHSRSHEYYAESVNNNKFVGTKCSTYKEYSKGNCASNPTANMGEYLATSASGTYYLDTNKKSPFAQG